MNEDPIDLRLRAALQHAPDGDLAPSTGLDQRIKAAARQALASQPAMTTQRRAWRDWLDRLLQPPAAAALATLALGTVIGVMWQGQVPPESMPGAPLASADLPAVVVRTEPKATVAAPPQATQADPPQATQAAPAKATAAAPPKATAAVPPQAPQTAPPHASAAQPPPAHPKPAAPVLARAPTAVAEAQETVPVERRSSSPLMQPTTPAATVAAAPTPPPAQAPPAAVEPAQAGAQNEVAALVSPPAPPQSSAPAAAAAATRPAAAAPPAAKSRSALRAGADSAYLPNRLAADAPQPPLVAELANAAVGPWQLIASDQMPEGGTFIRDALGQVLGRRLVQRDWLWWQPWINGQPAPQAQRAAARGAASAPQR